VSERFDLVALGETMLSFIAEGPLADAGAVRVTHGGAESNACVGLARSGLRAAWVSRLGADVPGDRVAVALDAEGVDVRWVARDPERPTGLMLRDTDGVVIYHRAGSAASALSPADLEGVPVGDARAVLVTGITALIGEAPGRAALTLFERAGGMRAFDPNLRPGLWGSGRARALLLPLVERSTLLLGGERELATLVGPGSAEELARRCRASGPLEVVVKRGPRGAAALDERGGWHELEGERRADVDPVGAGDAFNAGYLAARLAGADPPDALAEGARCGAAVATTVGDTEGFPISR
jgi:2-dehydro-3-deoxygluconokinase